jgi:hypothetical protein
MQPSIIEKLARHLDAGIQGEADVVYLLIEVGKYLEHERPTDRYPLLRFYRNWVAHSWIGNLKLAQHIPTELNNAIAAYSLTKDDRLAIGWINKAISMKRLRSELEEFLEETKLPTDVVGVEAAWRTFVRFLVGILADVPLVFKGFDHIENFKFAEFDREDDGEEKVGTWVIETPGCVFRGELFLS